jgi:nucleoside-diphosphate-sugar epimerase
MDKKTDAILVTGATGFLGQHVYKELEYRGYERIYGIQRGVSRRKVEFIRNWRFCDLRNHREVSKLFKSNRQIKNIKGVINLAASVGGIGANQIHQAEFMMDSLKIGVNLIDSCMHNTSMKNGGKFVQIGTVCAYPKYTEVPFHEYDLWNGYPEETNAPYGIAKKTIMELVRIYSNQYNDKFNGINLIPVNLYGPEDNFDLHSSHVIPAIIRKVDHAIDNNLDNITIWGTGKATREFLYVEDAAEAIVNAFELHNDPEPVNLGTGQEITILELVYTITKLMEYNGDIIFDTSKPDGQPRRCLDVSRAKSFNFTAKTNLEEGLAKTIQWYRNNKSWFMQLS